MGGDIGDIQLGSERELYKYINHYVVVKREKKNSKIILVQVNIIFALPDYSSGVICIERHQKRFCGRLINLALEFDIY